MNATEPTHAANQPTIHVVATTFAGTRAALTAAVPLAKGAHARLVVVVPRILPYAADHQDASTAGAFFAKRYKTIVDELGGEARIQVCVCRTLGEVLSVLVPMDSHIVVGGPAGRWLTSPEERFANSLSRAGRRVIFVPSGPNTTQRRVAPAAAALVALLSLTIVGRASAQPPDVPAAVSYGGFVDVAVTATANAPENHLFRSRGTTPRVDEVDVNMAGAYLRKPTADSSRFGVEVTAHAGEDSQAFGFSATAPNLSGAGVLLHLGPTNVSYLAPVGAGLTVQGGIFSSLIGYDSLYAKDNFAYTRPWGADFTPYLMMGLSASYPLTPRITTTTAVINGYWHLADANAVPSFVGQIAYKATDEISIKQTALYGPHQRNTSIGLWRVLSDTIVERKTPRLTTAFEYQFGTERVDSTASPQALWMSAQLPVHWTILGPIAATVRPEACWDSDGRWTGAVQHVLAMTAGGEYRFASRGAQAIVRVEYRIDDSRGSGGGFYAGADNHLISTQNLFAIALILTYDGTIHR